MVGKARKSLNKNKITCLQCKTPILENEDSMQCDVCEKTLHSVCTKLDKKEIDKLVKDLTLEYKCHFCAPSNKDVSVVSELSDIKAKLNQLDEIKETMQFMSSQFDAILKGVSQNKKKIEKLEKENNNLRDEVKQLKSSVKFLNDMRVQNDCVINGVKVGENEKPIDIVLSIANKSGANICEDEVEDAYFLNNNNKSSTKSVVVKFANKKTKKVFMEEKPKLKDIEELKNVYINDFLCKESMQLFVYAKSLKSVGYKFVFAKGGVIYARKDANSRPIRLRSMDEVDKLLFKSASAVSNTRRLAGRKEDSSDECDDDDGAFRSPN